MTERTPPPSIEERRGDGSTPQALDPRSEGSVGPTGSAWGGAAIGLVAGGVAIGVAHLVSGIVNPQASPVITVGQTAIDAAPEWLKSWAIRTFGQHDKAVLVGGIYLVLGVAALALGILSIRRPTVGLLGLAVFGGIGVLAALARPDSSLSDAVPAIAGLLAGRGAFSSSGGPGPPENRFGTATTREPSIVGGSWWLVARERSSPWSPARRETCSAVASSPMPRGKTSRSRCRRAPRCQPTRQTSVYRVSSRSSRRTTASIAWTRRSWLPRSWRRTGGSGSTGWWIESCTIGYRATARTPTDRARRYAHLRIEHRSADGTSGTRAGSALRSPTCSWRRASIQAPTRSSPVRSMDSRWERRPRS